MTWTNNFFLILTLTVTASCFLGLWSLGEKKWEKDGWTALASYLLYGVVLLHLVPVAYIIIMRSMVNSDGSMVGIAFEMTGKVKKITGFSGFCWIIGMAAFSLKYVLDEIFLIGLQFQCVPGRKREKEILERCCRTLKIHRRIRLYQDCRIRVPMINGIFFPQIYLPETEIFTEEELECIFFHELTHYRHGDILFRKLTALAGCVHWFNPIVRKKLYRFVAEYSEAHCDGTVCRKYVNPRLYCSVLLKAAQMRPKKAVSFMAAGLCEDSTGIERRIRRIKRMKEQGRKNLSIFIALSALIIAAGSMITYATSYGIVEFHEEIYNATVIEIEDNKEKADMTEYIMQEPFPGKIKEGTIEKEKMETDPNSNFSRIEWKLEPGEVIVSPKFVKTEEENISMSFFLEPEDIKIRGGIINKKGMKYYIEEKELLWHDFDLKECGDYQVFIENISDVSIQIYGFYN